MKRQMALLTCFFVLGVSMAHAGSADADKDGKTVELTKTGASAQKLGRSETTWKGIYVSDQKDNLTWEDVYGNDEDNDNDNLSDPSPKDFFGGKFSFGGKFIEDYYSNASPTDAGKDGGHGSGPNDADEDGCWFPRDYGYACLSGVNKDLGWAHVLWLTNNCGGPIFAKFCSEQVKGIEYSESCGASRIGDGKKHDWVEPKGSDLPYPKPTGKHNWTFVGSNISSRDWVCAGKSEAWDKLEGTPY